MRYGKERWIAGARGTLGDDRERATNALITDSLAKFIVVLIVIER